MLIQIGWLLQKPTDLDLHCLLRQGMSCSAREGLGFSRLKWVNTLSISTMTDKFANGVDLNEMAHYKLSHMDPQFSILSLTFVLPVPDMPCLCKQCRSRSVGFFRSQLVWICTGCHSVHEFVSRTWIKLSDRLTIRSGCSIIYLA